MFHEIYPYKFCPEYIDKTLNSTATLIYIFDAGNILLLNNKEDYYIPSAKDLAYIFDFEFLKKFSLYFAKLETENDEKIESFILFNKDLNFKNLNLKDYDLEFKNIDFIRKLKQKHIAFMSSIAYQVYSWLKANMFCGYCSNKMQHKKTQRALVCTKCKQTIYPRINPAIIVAIINKDKILLVKDKHKRYPNYTLVSGYMEIGETPEDTVRREAMEEVGLKLKNIRPYKNQAWGFNSSLMLGYIAEIDTDDTIKIQKDELEFADWFDKDKITVLKNHVSLAQEMIEMFKNNKL